MYSNVSILHIVKGILVISNIKKHFVYFFILFLGCIFSSLLFISSAFAEEGKIELTPELATQTAKEFVDSLQPNNDLIATNPVKFYNSDGQAIGYIISYIASDDTPNGYVVLDNTHDSLFSQWSFEPGSVSPVEREVKSIGVSKLSSCDSSDKVIKSAPFFYEVTSNASFHEDESMLKTEDGENFALSSTPNTPYWDMIFINAFNGKYNIINYNTIPGDMIAFTDDEIEALTGTYACAVSALLNCAPMYVSSFNWDNIPSYYSELWNLSSTSTIRVENGITYGSTLNENMGAAFKRYCSNHGVSINYTNVNNPSWNFFKSMIDRGDMGIFACGIMQNGNREGHAMTVEGYATLQLSNTISDNIYTLVVADGWDDIANVNLYYTAYTDTYGVAFSR